MSKQIKAVNELMASLPHSLDNTTKAFPLRDVESLAEIFAENNQATDIADEQLAKLREVYEAMRTLYPTRQTDNIQSGDFSFTDSDDEFASNGLVESVSVLPESLPEVSTPAAGQ